MALFHRKPDLSAATLAEFTAEAAKRGYELISLESAAAIDRLTRLTPADPKVLEEIGTALQSIPGLCREVAEKDAEVNTLRGQLHSARVREWWLVEGHLDQKWGAMALTRTEVP
jgi:hypothetical protein